MCEFLETGDKGYVKQKKDILIYKSESENKFTFENSRHNITPFQIRYLTFAIITYIYGMCKHYEMQLHISISCRYYLYAHTKIRET